MTPTTVSACKCECHKNITGCCGKCIEKHYTPTPTETVSGKKIRKSIRFMAKEGCSPVSIVFAHGQIVTPDERDYLLEYEKKYKEENKK